MKAVLLFGKYDAKIVDLPIPIIKENEILIKLKACGICGTDVEKYQGNFITPPVLGHEVVGIIEEVGKNLDYKKGDKVFVHHHVPCRVCYYCLRGDFTLCENFTKVNLDPCGLSEYIRVPEEIVKKGGVFLLDKINFEKGTFIEPLACCIRAINKIKPEINDKIVIFGAGPAGLLHCMLLNSMGISKIACVDINQKRLEFAKMIGAELTLNPNQDDIYKEIKYWSNNIGADISIVATSNIKAISDSINVVRKGGKICLFGSPKKDDRLEIEPSKIFIKEIKIIPSYSTTEYEIQQAIYLLETNKINPEIIITHRFSLENSIEALKVSEKGEAIKAIVLN